MVLVRQEIGDVLRDFRLQKGRTLRQVAGSASVALGYLSEVERGQKEASSEILAAVADPLDTPLSVSMGPSQRAKACTPPSARTISSPGGARRAALDPGSRYGARRPRLGLPARVGVARLIARLVLVSGGARPKGRTPPLLSSPPHFEAVG